MIRFQKVALTSGDDWFACEVDQQVHRRPNCQFGISTRRARQVAASQSSHTVAMNPKQEPTCNVVSRDLHVRTDRMREQVVQKVKQQCMLQKKHHLRTPWEDKFPTRRKVAL